MNVNELLPSGSRIKDLNAYVWTAIRDRVHDVNLHDDAYQEVMIALWKVRDNQEFVNDHWLGGVIRNTLKNVNNGRRGTGECTPGTHSYEPYMWKRYGRDRPVYLDTQVPGDTLGSFLLPAVPASDNNVIFNVDFERALNGLSEVQKQTARLVASGMTLREIGKEMGVAMEGARYRWKVAREKLRKEL